MSPAQTSPDSCGFDSRGQLVVDYGPRQFQVMPSSDGKLAIRELVDGVATGPRRTTLPAPRKADDPDLVAAAKAQVADSRRRVQAVLKDQRDVYRKALGSQERWGPGEVERQVLGHPVLRPLLAGVVWTLHGDRDEVVAAFRFDEEGRPVDQADEPVQVGDQPVGMAHPVDLDPALVREWQQVLSDYELSVPFRQLDYPIGVLPPDQGDEFNLRGLSGMGCHELKFTGVLDAWGWQFVGTRALLPWRWSNQTALLEYTGSYESTRVTRVVLLDGLRKRAPRKPWPLLPWSAAPAHLVHDVVTSTRVVG
ncbi:DUF4132 domain-containing protein [Propionibacteriaceae bacterium Y1923]